MKDLCALSEKNRVLHIIARNYPLLRLSCALPRDNSRFFFKRIMRLPITFDRHVAAPLNVSFLKFEFYRVIIGNDKLASN